jgi:hypothetical protein
LHELADHAKRELSEVTRKTLTVGNGVEKNIRKGRDKFPALFCQASHGEIDKKFLRPKIKVRNFYGFLWWRG